MFKILFVCTGNICRSPTAEGIMRQIVKNRGLEGNIIVDSAGISSYHSGDAPDNRSVICAAKHGIDITDLRSRPIRREDFMKYDLILAMDKRNYEDLEYIRPQNDERYNYAKVELILRYAPEYGQEVPDPYYHDGFDRVYEMIESACQNILNMIISKKTTN